MINAELLNEFVPVYVLEHMQIRRNILNAEIYIKEKERKKERKKYRYKYRYILYINIGRKK